MWAVCGLADVILLKYLKYLLAYLSSWAQCKGDSFYLQTEQKLALWWFHVGLPESKDLKISGHKFCVHYCVFSVYVYFLNRSLFQILGNSLVLKSFFVFLNYLPFSFNVHFGKILPYAPWYSILRITCGFWRQSVRTSKKTDLSKRYFLGYSSGISFAVSWLQISVFGKNMTLPKYAYLNFWGKNSSSWFFKMSILRCFL